MHLLSLYGSNFVPNLNSFWLFLSESPFIMKNTPLYILLIFASFLVHCQSLELPTNPPEMGVSNLYNQTIVLPANATEGEQAMAQEMADYLRKATGVSFQIAATHTGPGIYLLNLHQAPNLDQGIKSTQDDGFRLKSENGKFLITGNTETGLQYGIYHYLEQLGFRWYLPGENWTIIPQLTAIQKDLDLYREPAFALRWFGGTGGFGHGQIGKVNQYAKENWERWMVRAGWQSKQWMAGHMGNSFNKRNEAYLKAHPNTLAEVDGKRSFRMGAKHCYSDQALIDLMVKDRLAYYDEQLARGKFTAGGPASISVEPSDGGGHCECAGCAAMGHVSNRVFHGANAIAKALDKRQKGLFANLYAYYHHVEVPDFDLEDNIYVSLAPYKFQWASSPEDLIQRWKQKANHLMIYDYWALPTQNLDVPFNYLENPREKIPFWHQNGVEGFYAETSYSSMAAGLALYIGGKLMWDPQADVDALLAEFYQKSFGEAALPIQQMMESLATFSNLAFSLPMAFDKLETASSLTQNPAHLSRIDDLKAYVYYLHLLTAYQQAEAGSEKRRTAAEQVIRYVWRIRDRMLVHGYWVHYCISMINEKKDANFKKQWGFPLSEEKTLWVKNTTQVTGEEIQKKFEVGKRQRPIRQALPQVDASLPVTVTQRALPPGTRALPPADQDIELMMNVFNEMVLLPTTNQLTLKVKTRSYPNHKEHLAYMTLLDEDLSVVHTENLIPHTTEKSIQIALPSAGVPYHLRFGASGAEVTVKIPANSQPAFDKKARLLRYPKRLYFYVPEGEDKLLIACPDKSRLTVFDPEGKEVMEHSRKDEVRSYPIGDGQGGKVWALWNINVNNHFVLLNAPSYYSLFPEAVIKK